MTRSGFKGRRLALRGAVAAAALCSAALCGSVALAAAQPENILPVPASAPASVAVPVPAPSPAATPAAVPASTPAIAPTIAAVLPVDEPVAVWTAADAQALLDAIDAIGADGLFAADYQPGQLRSALNAGPGAALNAQASKSFAWLIEDVRDGRTRYDAREQWFVIDSDVEKSPTTAVITGALASHDVPGALAALMPSAPDYAVLKTALADTPVKDKAKRAQIRINLDRWRWLPRDLGKYYLLTNVPEFQLRLTVDNTIIRSYKTIVGKVGRTATPQLASNVQGVVFNPTWTVPQSIVVGEGLGARLIGNPSSAVRQGYKATKDKNGMITVVQQPGPGNSLGQMKLDMPNEHAIYLHDTPSRGLFAQNFRALSHGCVRTERATELGITMAILGAGINSDQAVDIVRTGKYTRVPMTKTFPVYIMYFTMASDITGKLGTFADLYGRDAGVLSAFAAPRKPWTGQRKSTEKVIKLDNPL